jgi:adenylate kinase
MSADRYRTILLFGAPGVGKGTQGRLLGAIPGMFHLATGDIFRSMDKHSAVGRRVLDYMSRGELVPDDLTIQLWNEHVDALIRNQRYSPQADLLMLDGIPRSIAQAKALDPHISVLRVIHLACPKIDEMITRMKRRAVKENRPDDANETIIRRRFEVYEQETQPVLSHYGQKLVSEIEATGSPAKVLLRVLEALVPVYDAEFENPLTETS